MVTICCGERIGLGSARPLPRDIKLLVSVGSCGLVFAAGPSSSCPFIVRVTLASPPSCSIGRNSVRKYEELRKRGDPSAPWQTIERAERLGDSLGAVSCIVMIDNKCPRTYDVGGDWAQKASAAEYDSGLQGTATGAKETPSFELPKFPRGMRAVLATGEFTSNADGAGDLGADLCILEHGLGLDAAVEGSTGLPEGATLFVQPLISEGLSKEGHRSRNDNCTTNGAADIADEGCAQFDYVILLSDRVRSQTHVMVTSLDGETAPVGGEKVHMIVNDNISGLALNKVSHLWHIRLEILKYCIFRVLFCTFWIFFSSARKINFCHSSVLVEISFAK